MSLRGLGRRLRMTMSGALFLSFLIASIAPAKAAVWLAAHAVPQAAAAAPPAAGPAISPAGHPLTGTPCNGQDAAHGLACCGAGPCPMTAGWIAAPANVAPVIPPAAQPYLNKALPPPDGRRLPPALRPPRHFA